MEQVKRVVFLGTKPIGAHCLAYLLEQRSALGIEVLAVGTQDRKEFSEHNTVSQLALEHGIPLIDHPDALPECDLIYSVQYHKILKQHHIDKAGMLAVNLHLAPLPDYRGCNQFSFAIFHGAATFGVTIHKLDSGVDSGDILFEDRFAMPEAVWVKDLFDISVAKGQTLFEATLRKVIKGDYVAQPQVPLIAQRGMHIHKRKDIDELKKIDLSEPEQKIQARIRATYMPGFEPPYTEIDGKQVYFRLEP